MKLSRYNIEKKEDKSCLIYNTVTSAILELDTDYEKSYYEMKEGKKCSKPDLESALLEGGMCKFRFIGSPIPLATDQCFRS